MEKNSPISLRNDRSTEQQSQYDVTLTTKINDILQLLMIYDARKSVYINNNLKC